MSLLFEDQMGRSIRLNEVPKRIVSLVPSQTELLYDLGLDKEVVGITKFCVHPESWRASKTHIGGTKHLKADVIRQLAPDLILGNKEENNREDMEQLMKEFNVWMSDIYTLEDALNMIESIGKITGKSEKAIQLKKEITGSFGILEEINKSKALSVLYLVWHNPFIAAGRDTFINDMLLRCGCQNVLPQNSRYPELSVSMIRDLNPQLILLSSEPFPFRQKHADEISQSCPAARVEFVDGEMFSWYGSRLLKAVPYFNKLMKQFGVGY